ncbi:MAG: alpha-D-ribose 1-methylphosphonate 5-triphosphate diphosphatase [Flavobacteriaceae bacterium]
MSAPEYSFRNARIVCADQVVAGSLNTGGGFIRKIDGGGSSTGEDMEGDFLLPGLVELHTDHLEGHYSPRPGVVWNAIAAVQAHDAQIATSGITTVLDAIRVGTDADVKASSYDLHSLIGAITAARDGGRLRADHLIHLRCEIAARDAVEKMDELGERGDIRLVSVMDHTPGQRQFVNLDKYREYYQGKSGMGDSEMDAYIQRCLANGGLYADANRREIVERCRQRGVAIASHDDATPEHVAEAVADGATISEFPTTHAAAEAARANGLSILMGAPNLVRGGSHSGNVSAADLAGEGRLDILSSDYIPFSLLQGAMLLPRRIEGFDMPRAVALVTRNPARAVGLDDRGEIAPGKRADLIRVTMDGEVPVVRAVWREGRRVA